MEQGFGHLRRVGLFHGLCQSLQELIFLRSSRLVVVQEGVEAEIGRLGLQVRPQQMHVLLQRPQQPRPVGTAVLDGRRGDIIAAAQQVEQILPPNIPRQAEPFRRSQQRRGRSVPLVDVVRAQQIFPHNQQHRVGQKFPAHQQSPQIRIIHTSFPLSGNSRIDISFFKRIAKKT